MKSAYQDIVGDLLLALEQKLITLEKNLQDEELAEEIAMDFRMLKGVASLFGYEETVDLAVRLEVSFHERTALQRGGLEGLTDIAMAFIDKVDNFFDLGRGLDFMEEHQLLDALEQRRREEGGKTAENTARKKGSILIIDDEASIRSLLCELINEIRPGAEVVTASSVAEGLFHYFTAPFDLVLLDIIMPVYSGKDFINLVEQVRQSGHLHGRPNIVVQTAMPSRDELLDIVQKESVQEVLRKPLSREQIYGCVERYCCSTPADTGAA